MNRCQALLASLFLALCTAASAQNLIPLTRAFPPAVQRGVMQVVVPPYIQLNGKTERLSPGARIRGTNNMLVMSGSIIGQSLTVNYLRNPTGEVHEVWVLTAAEAAQQLPSQP